MRCLRPCTVQPRVNVLFANVEASTAGQGAALPPSSAGGSISSVGSSGNGSCTLRTAPLPPGPDWMRPYDFVGKGEWKNFSVMQWQDNQVGTPFHLVRSFCMLHPRIVLRASTGRCARAALAAGPRFALAPSLAPCSPCLHVQDIVREWNASRTCVDLVLYGDSITRYLQRDMPTWNEYFTSEPASCRPLCCPAVLVTWIVCQEGTHSRSPVLCG
jgi:hypothetical protein